MNHNEARRILAPIMEPLNSERLEESGPNGYVRAQAGKELGTLDGRFTAEQLQAIAYWMRHPDEFKVTGPITQYRIECGTEEFAMEAVEKMPGKDVWSQFGDRSKPISQVESVEQEGTKVCIHLTEPVTEPTEIIIESFGLRGLKGYRDCHILPE